LTVAVQPFAILAELVTAAAGESRAVRDESAERARIVVMVNAIRGLFEFFVDGVKGWYRWHGILATLHCRSTGQRTP
jgi:hypothetical protein